MTPRRINPPHYFLGSLLLMIALAQVVWGSHLLPPPWQWLGVVPIVVGVLIAVLASRQFAQVGTNIVPLTKSTALVTNGMFARSRNPMYLGMVLTLAGLAWMLIPFWELRVARMMMLIGVIAIVFMVTMTIWGYLV